MRTILVIAALAMSLCASGEAQVSGQTPSIESKREALTLQTQVTEEGQTVIYDAYTWRRRELTKKLPLGEPWPTEMAIAEQFKRFNLEKTPVPETITVPSRIMKDLYLVNSVPNHTYLIDAGPAGLIVVDPGMEENVDSILRNITALGFSTKQVKWVINTHAHFDHSMADAHFQRLGAKILIGRADAAAVEKNTEIVAAYVLPADKRANYPTVHVDWPVDDGERLALGNKTIVAIATPGHTPGSTCYLLTIDGKTILFGGDTILFDYRLGAQLNPYIDNVAYLASLKKLMNFRMYPTKIVWDALMPGHGTIVLDRAYLDVMKGARQVQLNVDASEPVNALPFATEDYRKLMFGRP